MNDGMLFTVANITFIVIGSVTGCLLLRRWLR